MRKGCNHQVVFKKQLFKDGKTHIAKRCSVCDDFFGYAPKTKENLALAIGWVKESEETKLLDELLGLSGLKPSEEKLTKYEQVKARISEKKSARDSKCGNCQPCTINAKYGECICPCKWG